MIDVYEDGRNLFNNYTNSLVDWGWKKKELLPNVYAMTDIDGQSALVTCEYNKPYADKELYYITAIVETDNEKHLIHLGIVQ